MRGRALFNPAVHRRDLLRIGSLGVTGLALPDVLRAAATDGLRAGAAKSCLVFFLEGGPAQHDMWDMKPGAPVEIRGEFRPIASTIPGVDVCEHLPLTAQQMHHLCLIRSVHHSVVDHNAGTYYMLTGRSPVSGGTLIVRDLPENFPPYGAVLSKLRPETTLPGFVHIPEIMSNLGYDLPGERAGFLGRGHDPLVSGDPSVPGYTIPGLSLPVHSPMRRLHERQHLLSLLDQRAGLPQDDPSLDGLEAHYQQAFSLIQSPRTREAFDLSQEPAELRARYGLPFTDDRTREVRKFGGLPHLGQCCLLARRLIESGVRFVTLCTGRRIEQTWDGHRQHFDLLRKSILPYFDRAFSTLLADMHDRGLLEETLVVVMGEFGRTPKIGQVTSSAGATSAGRDHWPHCYTVMLGGAGIRGGYVHGSSDKEAAYPASNPVTPEDIAATIYHALGIDPSTTITDPLNRPHHLALGNPIAEVRSL
ncbi:MAG: DUF1501 domain-containing protein [Planctomycetaceae bacterium]